MAAAEYLVTYGQAGFLGRFRPPEGLACARGDRVVVRTARGLELGSVLCEASPQFAHLVGPEATGELLRRADGEDEALAVLLQERGRAILADGQRRAEALDLPLSLLDVEVLLDGTGAVAQAVHWGECDATPLFEALSREHGLLVKLQDLTAKPGAAEPEPEHAGCGKPGCGSGEGGCSTCGSAGGGGCSSGGCSRGKVKSAEELTAYFAGLRAQMEASQRRTPLYE